MENKKLFVFLHLKFHVAYDIVLGKKHGSPKTFFPLHDPFFPPPPPPKQISWEKSIFPKKKISSHNKKIEIP